MLLDRINDLENLTGNISINNTNKLLNYISQSNIENMNNLTLNFLNK